MEWEKQRYTWKLLLKRSRVGIFMAGKRLMSVRPDEWGGKEDMALLLNQRSGSVKGGLIQ